MTRSDCRVKRYSEPVFDYVNTSARPRYGVLRDLLESWFARFPRDAQHDLRRRFRQRADAQHRGALLELYVHELLVRMGYGIEVHPGVEGVEKSPDFAATRQGTRAFYVEATVALVPNDEAAAGAREAAVYDSLDRLESPDFFLHIQVRGQPASPPPGRSLARKLSRWLADLDYAPPEVTEGSLAGRPSCSWSHDGWDLTFTAIPKSSSLRGTPNIRPIGGLITEAKRVQIDRSIRTSLSKKAKRYGALDLPYLVIVNVADRHPDWADVWNALLGSEYVLVRTDGSVGQPGRNLDGFWYGPKGPRNEMVSGVVILSDLTEWTVGQNASLIHNPNAASPLQAQLWKTEQLVPDPENDSFTSRVGIEVARLLDLPIPWPPKSE